MDKQKQEKSVLNISFWTGVLFVVAEFIMSMYSHSQSVLTDTVFD
ncbi:MAG: iron transporter, partial [Erysipelotrichia bacterium]|nr:iron transporter [Erysipelotrichia bacterium]